jgi:hypothetical protein
MIEVFTYILKYPSKIEDNEGISKRETNEIEFGKEPEKATWKTKVQRSVYANHKNFLSTIVNV